MVSLQIWGVVIIGSMLCKVWFSTSTTPMYDQAGGWIVNNSRWVTFGRWWPTAASGGGTIPHAKLITGDSSASGKSDKLKVWVRVVAYYYYYWHTGPSGNHCSCRINCRWSRLTRWTRWIRQIQGTHCWFWHCTGPSGHHLHARLITLLQCINQPKSYHALSDQGSS